jgi:predicted DNA-binding protein
MATMKRRRKTVRRSIALPREIDSRVQKMARRQNRSANQVLGSLIETGLEARESERQRFFQLAERLRSATDRSELERVKQELARMTFGS